MVLFLIVIICHCLLSLEMGFHSKHKSTVLVDTIGQGCRHPVLKGHKSTGFSDFLGRQYSFAGGLPLALVKAVFYMVQKKTGQEATFRAGSDWINEHMTTLRELFDNK